MTISFTDNKELPQMKQYRKFKNKFPSAMLLFRWGDFYETYEEDARTIASILGITLTRRGDTHMAAFPHYALDIYLPKLVRAGYRVAICDPIDESQPIEKTRS